MVVVSESKNKAQEKDQNFFETLNLDNPISKVFGDHSKFFSISKHKMHYVDVGTGPCIVFIHGNPTSSFFFRKLIFALSSQYRVIAPDHLGAGLSSQLACANIPLKFSAPERTEHIKALLSHLQIQTYSLVMHDWGGPIGTLLALDNTKAIESLLYLNTTLTKVDTLPFFLKMLAKGSLGKLITQTSLLFLRATLCWGVENKLNKEVKLGYKYPFKTRFQRAFIKDFVREIPFSKDHPNTEILSRFIAELPKLSEIPTQIIWGMKDPCFHSGILESMIELFPKAKIQKIENASHLVLEDAAETVIETSKLFFEKVQEEKEKTFLRTRNFDNIHSSYLYYAFEEVLKTHPEANALIIPKVLNDKLSYEHYTYNELSQIIYKYQRGLWDLGLKKNERVLMLVQPSVDFLAFSYAVMGCGAVPVFIDPGIGIKQLLRCIDDAKAVAMIGTLKAHILRLIKPSIFKHLRFYVLSGSKYLPYTITPNYFEQFSSSPPPHTMCSENALIAFTSGATGVPKGVVYTQQMLFSQLQILKDIFEVQALKRDLPLLPVFSLFSLALGICPVFAPIDTKKPLSLDPKILVDIINSLSVSYSFGSPTLWNKISSYCKQNNLKLRTIEKVFMAGSPISNETLDTVQSISPNGKVFTPYGATEALPVTCPSSKDILEAELHTAKTGELGTLVGRPIYHIRAKIIRTSSFMISSINETVECLPFEIGEIIVCGENVSAEYLNRPEAAAESKIKDSERFWHRMGDMGYVDNQGQLYFCGRKAHAVEANGRTYYSIPVERIFNQHPKVKRSALVSLDNKAGIVIEAVQGSHPKSRTERHNFTRELMNIALSSSLTSTIEDIFFHPNLPVDARHNAKIMREQLSNWAKAQMKRKQA